MSTVISSVGRRIEGVRRQEESDGAELPYFTVEQARQFKPLFKFLNEKDRDILYLIFVSKKRQKDVQWILGRSQPSLCYDIQRIRRRLKFIFYLHNVFDIFLNFVCAEEERRMKAEMSGTERKELDDTDIDYANYYFSAHEMEVLTLMFYTSSFTLTARVLGVSQVKIRYIYNRCLRRIEETAMREGLNPENRRNQGMQMWEVYEIFLQVRSNLNIIKRVYRKWGKGRNPLFFA